MESDRPCLDLGCVVYLLYLLEQIRQRIKGRGRVLTIYYSGEIGLGVGFPNESDIYAVARRGNGKKEGK